MWHQTEFESENQQLAEANSSTSPTAAEARATNRASNLRSHGGRFLPTPIGQKTPLMLKVEQKLEHEMGKKRTIQQDYQEFYVQKRFSQRSIAARWGVPRNRIFFTRGRSPSWVQRLRLPLRSETDQDDIRTIAETPNGLGMPNRAIGPASIVIDSTRQENDFEPQKMKSQILAAAKEAFEERGADHSKNWKSVTMAWQGKCIALGQDRRIQHEVAVSSRLGQRLDVVDWKERCAYELNVSGKHWADEFYKDIFKVLAYNEAQPESPLKKLVFVTNGTSRRGLNTSLPQTVVSIVAPKVGFEVEIEYVEAAIPAKDFEPDVMTI